MVAWASQNGQAASGKARSRVTGAILRAALMGMVVALPHLLLGSASHGSTPIVALFAILAAAFIASEYSSPAPSLIEFRDARPYNRLRVVSVIVTLGSLGLTLGREGDGSVLTLILRALGENLGQVLDFPYSPIRLIMLMLPDDAGSITTDSLRIAASVAYVSSMAMVVAFVLAIRLGVWPRGQAFNVWVNLPQFDPTAGGDVVERLQSDSQINLSLGFTLPFLLPMALELSSAPVDRVLFGDPTAIVWTVTAWAFLPASLLMRGVALERVARMIAIQRARAAIEAATGLQTA